MVKPFAFVMCSSDTVVSRGGGATATTTDGRRSRLESQLGPKSQLDPNAKLDPNSQKAETNFVSRTGIFTFSTSGGIIISQSIEEAVAKAEVTLTYVPCETCSVVMSLHHRDIDKVW